MRKILATNFILLTSVILSGFSFNNASAQGPGATPANPNPGTGGGPGPTPANPNPGGGGTGGGGDGLSYSLQNPLAFDSVQDFLVAILNVLIILATPIVVLFIILAGFKYVTAQGNEAKVTEAHRALTYAIVGGVLIIGAVALAQIIGNIITAFSA